MTAPWFTPETYSMMPGLIIGLSGGVYGVLIGVFNGSKNFEQYYKIISFIMVLICIGLIVFGVVASFYDQPESAVHNFIGAGVISLIVFSALWYLLGQGLSEMSLTTQELDELIKKRSSPPNNASDTESK